MNRGDLGKQPVVVYCQVRSWLSRRRPGWMAVATMVWGLLVVAAVFALTASSNSPGPAGTPPAAWPEDSQLGRRSGVSTLVLFAHPRCPCTRASFAELERLLARVQGALSVHVVFLRPLGTDDDWAPAAAWREAARLPGVLVDRDDSGGEARRFQIETSGTTLLYDPEGRLLFHGGITLSRGHTGDNPGSDAILDLLRLKPSRQSDTPVFGCLLFSDGAGKGPLK